MKFIQFFIVLLCISGSLMQHLSSAATELERFSEGKHSEFYSKLDKKLLKKTLFTTDEFQRYGYIFYSVPYAHFIQYCQSFDGLKYTSEFGKKPVRSGSKIKKSKKKEPDLRLQLDCDVQALIGKYRELDERDQLRRIVLWILADIAYATRAAGREHVVTTKFLHEVQTGILLRGEINEFVLCCLYRIGRGLRSIDTSRVTV